MHIRCGQLILVIMRTSIFYILISILIISCSTDPREAVIADYVQIIDGTKTNMDFKLLKFISTDTIKGADSAKYYQDQYDKKLRILKGVIDLSVGSIKRAQDEYDKYQSYSATYRSVYKSMLEDAKESRIKRINELENFPSSNSKLLEVIDRYEGVSEKTLGFIAKCTYRINNPLLNSVEQEITKTFVFSADNSSILSTLEH